MNTYEFIEETDLKGQTSYYTRKNGEFVSDSLSFSKDKAQQYYNFIIENDGVSVKKVLETITK